MALPELETVYNLEVEHAHTYFVGATGVWVHNQCGRGRRQQRLRELGDDPNVSSADRGWIKQEINAIKRGNRTSIRNPPGKDLAHSRGREAGKNFDHVESLSHLQNHDLHLLQHRKDNNGRKNRLRD